MRWILQDFEDTRVLSEALDQLGLRYSWHKVIPFVGDLIPEPELEPGEPVILFGSYTLWRYAERRALTPGVFKLRPFVHERVWQPFMLNGAEAMFLNLRDVPARLANDDKLWFMRPVNDSKEEPGRVRSAGEIIALADKVLTLDEEEIPLGALRHDTELMLTEPVRILKEWRFWVVDEAVVTYSLYKEGARVVYRPEVDDDALDFAADLVALNPGYAKAYVIDVCRTEEGLRMLETNCINAAGFYAADLIKLASALKDLSA